VFAGLLVGAMLPYWFSAMTMKSVGKAALAMVEEVRRQFNTIEGLMEGTARPDYVRCVEISTQARAAALSAQPRPALRPHPASSSPAARARSLLDRDQELGRSLHPAKAGTDVKRAVGFVGLRRGAAHTASRRHAGLPTGGSAEVLSRPRRRHRRCQRTMAPVASRTGMLVTGSVRDTTRAGEAHGGRARAQASLSEMIPPGALVMLTPVVVGILFGTKTLAGLLAGALVSGVQMAVSMSNTGGAWDNAKKYVEARARPLT